MGFLVWRFSLQPGTLQFLFILVVFFNWNDIQFLFESQDILKNKIKDTSLLAKMLTQQWQPTSSEPSQVRKAAVIWMCWRAAYINISPGRSLCWHCCIGNQASSYTYASYSICHINVAFLINARALGLLRYPVLNMTGFWLSPPHEIYICSLTVMENNRLKWKHVPVLGRSFLRRTENHDICVYVDQ